MNEPVTPPPAVAAGYTPSPPPLPFASPDFEERVQQAIQMSRASWVKTPSTKRYLTEGTPCP